MFQLLNQVIRISAQLLLVPLFLAAWGPAIYKDWVVLFSIMSFLTTCNLGAGTYFANRFIELVARGERSALRRELRTALFCALTVGIVVLLAGYAAMIAYDSQGFLASTAMGRKVIWECLVLMTFPVSYSFCEEILRSMYRAEGEFNRGECVFAIYAVVLLISVATVLALRMPPMVAASCYFVVPALLFAAVIIDLKHRYADIVIGFRVPTRTELRVIVAPSLLFFTAPLSVALVQSGPIILFGALGVAAVPVLSYTLVRVVAGLARQAAYQFAIGSGIEMARHHLQGERQDCYRLYQATGQIVTGLVGLFSGFILWATAPFLAFWTHGTVPSDSIMLICFLGGLFLSAPGQAGLMLLNFANYPRPLAIAWCGQAVIGLALSAALVPSFGVAAAAFGFAVVESVATGLFLPLVVQRRFGYSAIGQLARSFAVGALAFGWSALVASAIFRLGLGGLEGLVLDGLLWAVITIPPFGMVMLPPPQRRRLLSRLRGLVARFA